MRESIKDVLLRALARGGVALIAMAVFLAVVLVSHLIWSVGHG